MADAEMLEYVTEQASVAADTSVIPVNADAEMPAIATERGLQLIPAGPTGSASPEYGMDLGTDLHAEMPAIATERGLQLITAGPIGSASPEYGMDLGTDLHDIRLITQRTWEIHVEFKNGMWWAMPHYLCDPILEQWRNGAQEVSFIWDWNNTRQGSYQPDGEVTSINRYIIDFSTMLQRNIDNHRTRKVKLVCIVR